MKGFCKSDIGRIRELNEDSVFVSNEPVGRLSNLYIVADGMGGYKGGEVASSSAIKYFCEYCRGYEGSDDTLDIIIAGVRYANSRIIEDAEREPERLGGMGTTFTAVVVENGKLYIAHVGDSRLYTLDDWGNLRQITTDHSYVMELVKAGKLTLEEAKHHPDRNFITRALGVRHDLLVDGIVSGLARYVILCTDGLTNMLSDDDIKNIVSSEDFAENKVGRLVYEANCRGGSDNISVILIDREVG
ncbi:MAG: Stp1/IreP family PP2C-type Ser/Thr phosphatase [Clostridiales bacterium]|nr:Stp1/IreP family PP2C-type Ser/Thr phosphatase [Clostridiales bacterium]